jgi:DNA-directed RNA polymerase specialized sigma24 family protein
MPSLHTVEMSAHIITRAQAGDREAQECIYLLLSKPVYTLIRRLIIRPAVAQELLQDVFVEILRNMPSYSGAGSFIGWVKSIAVSKALMYLRSPWHRSLTWFGADGAVELHQHAVAATSGSIDIDLQRALEALPSDSRAVVWLHDVEVSLTPRLRVFSGVRLVFVDRSGSCCALYAWASLATRLEVARGAAQFACLCALCRGRSRRLLRIREPNQ